MTKRDTIRVKNSPNFLLEGGLFLLFTTFVWALYYYHQPVLSYEHLALADGNQYVKMYQYFTGEMDAYRVSFPFHSRMLVPWLASLVPANHPIQAFHTVNFVFTLLSVVMLLMVWRKLNIPFLLRLLGISWLLLHWIGIVRHNIFDPITVDVPLYFFQALLLYLLIEKRYVHLLWLTPLAAIQKESFIALIAGWLVYETVRCYLQKKPQTHLFFGLTALLIGIGAQYAVGYWLPPIEAGQSSVRTILVHGWLLFKKPFRVIRWITALFIAYGAFLYVGGKKLSALWQSYPHQLLLLFSGIYLFFGLFAGGDFTRILFLGFPFIMTYLLIALRDEANWLPITMFTISIPILKITQAIPDAGKNWEAFREWFPEFAPVNDVWYMFAVGIITLSVVGLLDRFFRRPTAHQKE